MSQPKYLSMLFGLDGKTVLLTGGVRGIGRQIAFALAEAGADIVLLARRPEDVDSINVATQVESFGRRCRTYKCDLSERAQVLGVVPQLHHDGVEIDCFVHCAGLQHRSPAEDFADDEWDTILGVNITAGFQLSRDLAKYWLGSSLHGYATLEAQEKSYKMKKILFIASVLSFTGGVETPAYTASKGAVAQLTKALNNEWMSKGICVNSLAPGYIQTDLTAALRDGGEKERKIVERIPAGRWGHTDDLSGGVIYLLSRAGNYVGGEIHAVDGGFLGR
ncbi:hypothetical protein BP5796_03180 [Coleophoma crateriformis]|uniref:Ketoreductase domain-containing protein n=1 Tax=Coleophoma crateriformis TaxID=565419 RepID=A0A3D8SMI3_9HELO|nr:hypothetical protein BP5796_03180 [Coleophoma crateriformis]